MDPDADREQALANNYEIKSDEHKLQNLKTNEQADATKADLEDKRNQVYSSLKTQYNAVLDAKDALDAAGISVVRRWVETLVPCPYSLLERLKSETAAWGGVIPETEYGADVTLTVLLPEEKAEAYLAHILDMTAGTVEGIATGERFQDVPWRPAGGAGGPG